MQQPLKCGTKAGIIFCSVSIISLETFCNIFMFFMCHAFLLTIALIGLAVLYGALFSYCIVVIVNPFYFPCACKRL